MFQSFSKLNWLLASKIIRTFAKCIVTSHSITIFKKYEQNTAGLQLANLSRLTPFTQVPEKHFNLNSDGTTNHLQISYLLTQGSWD